MEVSRMTKDKNIQSTCPECEAVVQVNQPETGEVITCKECGADLEIVSLQPLQFHTAPKIEEDWGE